MRLQTLLGIRETGFDRAPQVPLDPRITLELYRSTDYILPFYCVDTQGVPVDLAGAGTTVTLTMKKRPTDHAVMLSTTLTLTPGEAGRGIFTIPSSIFDFALEGSYFYEVMGVFGGLRDPLVPLSPLRIMIAGTRSAC
jgi:hypothetical protein